MIVRILGILDLLTAIAAVFVHIGFLPVVILKYFIFYLLIKGVIFIKSLTSIIDLLCGIYLIALYFGFHSFIIYIVGLYLFQKAVISMIS